MVIGEWINWKKDNRGYNQKRGSLRSPFSQSYIILEGVSNTKANEGDIPFIAAVDDLEVGGND